MSEVEFESGDAQMPDGGRVPWPGSGSVMDKWVQAALDAPRVGDVFHEMYSFGVEVTAVGPDAIAWRSFNTATIDTGVKTRDEWSQSFRYRYGSPDLGHTMQLATRGVAVTAEVTK